MPVYKPTASCIWKSFQNSGKKKLVLIGGKENERNNLLEEILKINKFNKDSIISIKENFSGENIFVVDLDNPYGKTGCIIMASGKSTRFGENKLLVDFGSKTLIQWILNASDGIFSKRVVVTVHKEIEKLCKEQNIPVILHNFPYRNDVIRLGIEAMENQIERCVFFPADQPLIKTETIAALILSANNNPDFIWRPCCKDVVGSPVVFPKKYFEELKSLPKGKGGNTVVSRYKDKVRTFSVSDINELKDIDTKEDMQKLIKTLGFK